MVEFKLVINNPKTGKSYPKTITGEETYAFKNKKIKDKVIGNTFGFKNYEFEITGGSDNAGFPMRYDLEGQGRKRILLTKGPCVKIKRKGMRKRKTVRGNVISPIISQINLKIIKQGDKALENIFGKEEKKEKQPKEETKQKPKKEVKKEEKPKKEVKKEEKPKKEVKKEEKPKKEN